MGFVSHMEIALEEAAAAGARGEVPVGACVIGPHGEIVSRAGNRTRELADPSAHAELLAIRQACSVLGQERLKGHSLYVTLEPCAMCAGLIAASRIARLYFGASDPKSGGVLHGARVFEHAQAHHKPEVFDAISERECADLLREFFGKLRG